MAHYAFIDEQGIVTEVIVGRDEDQGADWAAYYAAVRGQRCLRTSYNGRIRGKYAAIGDVYNEQLDVFSSPCPGEGWILDETTGSWVEQATELNR
jgi:hypothetical protein